MRKTPSKMHMHDMVRIDFMVFEIVVGEGRLNPPPRSLAFSNTQERIGFRWEYASGTRQFHHTVINYVFLTYSIISK